MISKPFKHFVNIGCALIVLIGLIPIGIHYGRPYFFKDRVAAIRTEQLALQAKRKPVSRNATPTPSTNPVLPETLRLAVPFTSQAPTANWDELHNEACEEASIIMANAYFNGITSLPPQVVESEIGKMTEWQNENYGYHLSINTAETISMIEAVYGLEAESTSINERAIKQALNQNKLVILPANGRMLGNPNFRAPGPIYHMLVITGYDEDSFITNDPGTRNGKEYKYSYDVLQAATGNYDHNTHEVDLRDKQMIVVSK